MGIIKMNCFYFLSFRFIADYIRRQFLGVQSQCVGVTICLLMQRLGLSVNMEIEQRDIGMFTIYSIHSFAFASTLNQYVLTMKTN